MRRRGREVPLSAFEPPDAAAGVEFSEAQLALIEIGRRQSGLGDPVDAFNFVLARIEMEGGRRQREVLDDITAQVGREKRDDILLTEAKRLGTTPARIAELQGDPERYRAVMDARRRYGDVDIEAAIGLLAKEAIQKEVRSAVVTDRWAGAFNRSKPPRGDDWRRMDKLGPMIAAEIEAEKKAKAALKPKSSKPKKPSWRKNPKFKEAAVYFAATGRGIVPDKLEELNRATGREAKILADAAALDEYAGFPWPKDGD